MTTPVDFGIHAGETLGLIGESGCGLHLGKIVEPADSDALCARPMHPYTQALFAAALPSHPDDQPQERTVAGEVPSALNLPSGCRFHPRCPSAMPVCSEVEPAPQPSAGGGEVACHLH